MSQPTARRNNGLNRVHIAAAFELTAEEIRRAIAMGRYGAGDRLPNERELSAQLGVSRATLREATRALVAEGLLVVRRGAHGGIRVTERVAANKTDMRALLRGVAAEIDAILDVRVALESGAAHLAAGRRNSTDLMAMQDAFDRMQAIFDADEMSAVSEFWRADADFHDAIASSTRSPRLVAAVQNARIDFFQSLGAVFSAIDPNAHDGHLEMLTAIQRSAPDAASNAAREHIEVTRKAFYNMANMKGARRHAR